MNLFLINKHFMCSNSICLNAYNTKMNDFCTNPPTAIFFLFFRDEKRVKTSCSNHQVIAKPCPGRIAKSC